MIGRARQWSVACLAAVLLCGAAARAEISVTVTITGELEEMLPLLEFLQQMGPGIGPPEADPLKLEVHSVHEDADTEPLPEEVPPAEDPQLLPLLDLRDAEVQPTVAEAGSPIFVSVDVLDEVGAIDTVSGMIEGLNFEFDLHDSGTHGDLVAGDGIWSADVLLPPNAPPGTHRVVISAYDANGMPVRTLGLDGAEHTLQAGTELEVVR